MKIPQQVVSDSLKILLRGTMWLSDTPQGQGIKKQNCSSDPLTNSHNGRGGRQPGHSQNFLLSHRRDGQVTQATE